MRITVVLVFFIFTFQNLIAGEEVHHRTIKWNLLEQVKISENESIIKAGFRDAQYDVNISGLPYYSEIIPIAGNPDDYKIEIKNAVFDIASEGFEGITGIELVGPEIIMVKQAAVNRKVSGIQCRFIPIRQNPFNLQYEVLVSFDLVVTGPDVERQTYNATTININNSILASGDWYKFSVDKTGIYRINYGDLQSMGIDPSQVDPRNIRIYGNGGGMLPESLNEFRHDDLAENNIFISGEGDGQFNQQDYILFYGESPNVWKYQAFSQAFNHEQNLYSDSTYYFLNFNLGPGKRISLLESTSEPANVYVNKFIDYAYHEVDLFNLANIGRVWYGEVFDVTTSYDFNFSFPDIDLSSPAYIRAYVAAKSETTTKFTFHNGNQDIMSAIISGIPATADLYARPYIGNNWFIPTSKDLNIGIDYEKNISSSIGWLNFLEINVTRNLVFSGSQMSFRDPVSVSPGNIVEFTLGNAGTNTQIWHVSDPTKVEKVESFQSGNSQIFRMAQDTLQEFIAFDGSSYLQVHFSGKVTNQDLHGAAPADMIIITHPLFSEQAERLAEFHRVHDGMTIQVTEIDEVYNEFSSGAQDITAIRNYMKQLYESVPAGEEPKYLLLFGDASFDYKDRIENNSNFVPTWEDEESLIIVKSIASDDYYGFLDGPSDNVLDIGIGRLPVQTAEQAEIAVDKIIHYATNTSLVMKDWRNVVCFVADDEDGNMHLRQAEEMSEFLDTNYHVYNIDKIFVDAVPQVSTPAGQRAPEVNQAINNRIDKGCLIMNYTGHGGEVGWGHERFLENSDIESWTNYDYMPIFITATCEFSRYDDPERTSAGEYTFLNPHGGAIAMFTTARATFGGSNFNLNTALFDYIFEENNGDYYRFGDLIRLSKNNGGVDGNDKKFILLGDPALHLAYPENEVVTTKINGEDVGTRTDTLQALQTITIEGEVIITLHGDSPFNGTVYPIVYDKPAEITSLATDDTSYPYTFEIQNNILYKGKAQVTDGKFSFTFIVPKDIAYQYGFGKISYYAANEEDDAHGYYDNIMVGGLDQSVEPDNTGPTVELYMNNPYFISGGITDENPDMLAYVHDESGINTVGTGIGHDLVAILDGNTEKPIILNEFYESDLDSYISGTIRYPFYELEEGLHTLSLKVWDVFNNSTEAYIEFNVVSSDRFVINDLMNYPNPFITGTSFVFSHNQAEGDLDIRFNIYNLSGQLVKNFETNLAISGYRTEPILWDGTDDGGASLSKGMYIYTVIVKNDLGQTDEKSGKLIMVK